MVLYTVYILYMSVYISCIDIPVVTILHIPLTLSCMNYDKLSQDFFVVFLYILRDVKQDLKIFFFPSLFYKDNCFVHLSGLHAFVL